MTDKQIMIDGINVSECRYFNGYQRIVRNNECIVDMQNACIEEIKTKPCSQKHNCYFKNWQRKEQECERLKKEKAEILEKTGMIETLQGYTVKDIEYMEQQLDQLKEENEELKQFLSKEPLAIQALQSAYSDYKKRSEVFFEMIGEYKQTLAEIKEIAIFNWSDKNMGFMCNQILQKINECEIINE